MSNVIIIKGETDEYETDEEVKVGDCISLPDDRMFQRLSLSGDTFFEPVDAVPVGSRLIEVTLVRRYN